MPPASELERGPRRHGPGLRIQILIALSLGFGLAALLVGLATTRLGRHAAEAEQQTAGGTLAEALLLANVEDAEDLAELASSGDVLGIEVHRGDRVTRMGTLGGGVRVERRRGDDMVIVSLRPARSPARRSLPSLLLLYVGVTTGAIVLLGYVLLTRLIVRPLDSLTRASERIAEHRREERVPVRGASEIARLAISFNDMQTQLAEERRALRERLEELEQAHAELATAQQSLIRSEKMASVGRLSAGIAHEIGNPLTSILGLVELVEEGGLEPDEEREFLSRVKRETERIHRTIGDLLRFARAEPPDEGEAHASCDLVRVVSDAVRLVAPQKDIRRIRFEEHTEGACPPVVGGADRLGQVVLNLLLNAADAIAGEGVVQLQLTPRDGGVELEVIDTGPGIDPELIEQIFEPFVTTKPPGSGTGLGLAVCHSLAEQLGGTLTAKNVDGGGACFSLWLPAA